MSQVAGVRAGERDLAFTEAQVVLLGELLDLIFPASESGESATVMGLLEIALARLDSPWGRGHDRYLAPPFEEPSESGFGWQGAAPPRDVVASGLLALELHLRSIAVSSLGVLDPAEQSELVRLLRTDALAQDSAVFFDVVRQLLIDGLFDDGRAGRQSPGSDWLAAAGRDRPER